MLVLSYEFIKPEYPDIHNALAQWVQDGGALIYVGDDSDPYHGIRSWWNNDRKDEPFGSKYNSPREHLFEQLGLKGKAEGIHPAGKGVVCWLDQHPAELTLSKAGQTGCGTPSKPRWKHITAQNDRGIPNIISNSSEALI